MRRFSQRNQLVTLNDINITPLLDLAFVLLIIFIITTPLLEQSIRLEPPAGGEENARLTKDDVRLVEITPEGNYRLQGHGINLTDLEAALVHDAGGNPKLAVRLRADKKQVWEKVAGVMEILRKHRIRMDIATVPERK